MLGLSSERYVVGCEKRLFRLRAFGSIPVPFLFLFLVLVFRKKKIVRFRPGLRSDWCPMQCLSYYMLTSFGVS
jgi:hypothetical protein